MADEIPVARRQVRITNPLGLHLRADDQFVRVTRSFRSEVWVTFNGVTVNGKSILELTTLAAESGAMIDVEVRGPDAEETTAALAELATAGFHEVEGNREPRAETDV